MSQFFTRMRSLKKEKPAATSRAQLAESLQRLQNSHPDAEQSSERITSVAPTATISSSPQSPFDYLPRQPTTLPFQFDPIQGDILSYRLCIGGGVAIFHLATACVVICRHSVKGYWFLPKGRRDIGEDSCSGAEREGFEEVS